MKEESFVKIPRSLFRSEGWKKATKEQRLAIVDLYYRVAYSEYNFQRKNGDIVPLKKGQIVVTQRELGALLEMDRKKAMRIIEYWQSQEIIMTQQMGQGTNQYSILTISALSDNVSQGYDPRNDPHKEENINKKK